MIKQNNKTILRKHPGDHEWNLCPKVCKRLALPPRIIIPTSRRGSDHGSSPIPEVYPDNLSINRPWSWSSYPPHLVGKFPSLLGVLASSNLVFDDVRLLSDCFLALQNPKQWDESPWISPHSKKHPHVQIIFIDVPCHQHPWKESLLAVGKAPAVACRWETPASVAAVCNLGAKALTWQWKKQNKSIIYVYYVYIL